MKEKKMVRNKMNSKIVDFLLKEYCNIKTNCVSLLKYYRR